MKKIIAILLAAMLCLPFGVTAFAEGEMPTFSGGSGTQEDPFIISTVEDLQTLAETVNSGKAQSYGDGANPNYLGMYFKQVNNIDLASVESWEPIGYSSAGFYFSGNYDGGNYKIKNMKTEGKLTVTDDPDANDQNSAGFFGWVAFGSVSNLHIVDASSVIARTTTGQPYAGGMAAVIYGSSVYNCTVTNSNISVVRESKNTSWAGGLAGWSYGASSFENCAGVGNTVTGDHYVGGMIGEVADFENAGLQVTFKNCYVADCKLYGNCDNRSFANYIGGFVGDVMFDYSGCGITFENSYVYNNTIALTEEAETNNIRLFQGIFIGDIYADYAAITHKNTYYYTADTENLGEENTLEGTVSKTVDEFSSGTVIDLLGEAFIQDVKYPILATLVADYSELDKAIEEAEKYMENKDKYEDISELEEALENAKNIDRNLTIADQDIIDEAVKALKEAHAYFRSSDEENHWLECDICGNKINEEAHTYEPKLDDNNHWKECECGHIVNEAPHSYEPKFDGDNHWEECECGHIINEEAHNLKRRNNSVIHWYECNCGHTEGEDKHTMVTVKITDDEVHEKCKYCSYETVSVVIGGDKPDYSDEQNPNTGAAVVSPFVFIALAGITLIKKKK